MPDHEIFNITEELGKDIEKSMEILGLLADSVIGIDASKITHEDVIKRLEEVFENIEKLIEYYDKYKPYLKDPETSSDSREVITDSLDRIYKVISNYCGLTIRLGYKVN